MLANAIVIAGLPIPDDRPIFLAVLAVHVTASAVCVLAGALAALSRKRVGRHPVSGWVYYWSLTVAFAALVVLALRRWPHGVGRFSAVSTRYLRRPTSPRIDQTCDSSIPVDAAFSAHDVRCER